eukprot:764229-Hanusia_phi.AAC.1
MKGMKLKTKSLIKGDQSTELPGRGRSVTRTAPRATRLGSEQLRHPVTVGGWGPNRDRVPESPGSAAA